VLLRCLHEWRSVGCCWLVPQGLRAPLLSEIIYGREWLGNAAAILTLQVTLLTVARDV
jgi:hypothetical protein